MGTKSMSCAFGKDVERASNFGIAAPQCEEFIAKSHVEHIVGRARGVKAGCFLFEGCE